MVLQLSTKSRQRKDNKMDSYLETINGKVSIKAEQLARFVALKDKKDQAEKELKEITSGIVNECKERFNETTNISGYNFTCVGNFGSVKFNEERFKEENLQLYIKYLEPSFIAISYKLVSAERKKKGE